MKLFRGIQFGLPKIKGLEPYLDSLFTKAGEITNFMVMPKSSTGTAIPWVLVYWKEEDRLTVHGPFDTIERAILVALRIREPYILILHKDVTHFELEELIKSVWIKRKKCAVFALPKIDEERIRRQVGDLPTEAVRELAKLEAEIGRGNANYLRHKSRCHVY